MRKFLIKYFALDYHVIIFGQRLMWTRSANVLFPLFVLCGYLSVIESALLYYVLPILTIAAFFGFVYFRIRPIKNVDVDMFDDVQKYSFSKLHNKNDVPEAFNSLWVVLINPISILLFILIFALFK